MLSQGAIRLRRLAPLHRVVRWSRRTFWAALKDGGREFSRRVWANSPDFGPPSQIFSLYQSLRTGIPKRRGRIVLEDQGNPPVIDPDSILVTGGYEQYREQPWPILWTEHTNARLVASSLVLMEPGKKICLEAAYGPHRFRGDPAFNFFRLPPVTRLEGNWTSIVSRWVPTEGRYQGMGFPNYTHWLLDALPRLALLSEFPADTKILIPADTHRNQLECLALLGLADRCRPTRETHLELEHYYFSSPTTMLEGYSPYGIDFLRRSFLPKRDQSYQPPKRVFIHRRGLSREPKNAAQVEKFFVERGWTPVDVAKLSFAQQVQLYHEAESIAGMFGSGFTNCVFCRPGCEVLPIMSEIFGMDGFLEWIKQLVGFTVHPVVVPCGYDFQYEIDLNELQRWLDNRPGLKK